MSDYVGRKDRGCINESIVLVDRRCIDSNNHFNFALFRLHLSEECIQGDNSIGVSRKEMLAINCGSTEFMLSKGCNR